MNTRHMGGMRATAMAAVVALVLTGCLGKPPPVEEYLTVHQPGAKPCAQEAEAKKGGLVVAVKGLGAVDALNRQAVLIGRGRVQSPSLAWYWEAGPQQLVGQAVVEALACSPGLIPVSPVRSTTRADRVLTGQVTDFWVDVDAKILHVGARVQLWDAKETGVLAGREFAVQSRLGTFDAQGVAEAGAKALDVLGADVAAWLERNAGPK